MPKAAKVPSFATEAEMCAAFIEAVQPQGKWEVYSETAGWDILLHRKTDHFQIGIQAKLKLNTVVVNQCLGDAYNPAFAATKPGPDVRAILVPSVSSLENICDHLGLTVIRLRDTNLYGRFRGSEEPSWEIVPPLPTGQRHEDAQWHDWCPTVRHALPDYVPDCPAGTASPLRLTKWKIQAIKILIILERRGYLTRADFKFIGIDYRRWVLPKLGWLQPNGSGGYIASPRLPPFAVQHPQNYLQILADFDKWKPADMAAI